MFDLFFRRDLHRYDIINKIIEKYNFKKYLEIGVNTGETFVKVNCSYKVSVDPEQYGYTTCQMTSDEYFEKLDKNEKFDLIFVDGLHTYEQCYKDLENSIKHLSDDGFIVCHDMNPPSSSHAKSEYNPYALIDWNGDVYKAFIKFRKNHLNYSSCMLYDCDWGIGVITKGIGQAIQCDTDNMSYDDFANNKMYLMNCIKSDDFIKNFC